MLGSSSLFGALGFPYSEVYLADSSSRGGTGLATLMGQSTGPFVAASAGSDCGCCAWVNALSGPSIPKDVAESESQVQIGCTKVGLGAGSRGAVLGNDEGGAVLESLKAETVRVLGGTNQESSHA